MADVTEICLISLQSTDKILVVHSGISYQFRNLNDTWGWQGYDRSQQRDSNHAPGSIQWIHLANHMMTSSNGNIFRVAGPVTNEFRLGADATFNILITFEVTIWYSIVALVKFHIRFIEAKRSWYIIINMLSQCSWYRRTTGLILGLCPANERRRYIVTTYLIGWAQA